MTALLYLYFNQNHGPGGTAMSLLAVPEVTEPTFELQRLVVKGRRMNLSPLHEEVVGEWRYSPH
jgi:hypothetical protein